MMDYSAIGMMSGSSLDGLDIVFAQFHEDEGKWSFNIVESETVPFSNALQKRLLNSTQLNVHDYLALDADFGKFCGERVNNFLKKNKPVKKADVIGCHGHTTYHEPAKGITQQIGNGAAIAAITGIPVVTEMRSVDVALGGQGAPVVPIGEKFLFGNHRYYLNIGGIANLSVHDKGKTIAFDVCPANRVLNMLASLAHKKYDKNGQMASSGKRSPSLFSKLNKQKYYSEAYPKSLANSFGTDIIYPIITNSGIKTADALNTYTEHIAWQVMKSVEPFRRKKRDSILVTGGGALNVYLTNRLRNFLDKLNIEIIIPDKQTVEFKEALIMAFIAVLRIRNEVNVLSSVTGASRDSVNGALFSGK